MRVWSELWECGVNRGSVERTVGVWSELWECGVNCGSVK